MKFVFVKIVFIITVAFVQLIIAQDSLKSDQSSNIKKISDTSSNLSSPNKIVLQDSVNIQTFTSSKKDSSFVNQIKGKKSVNTNKTSSNSNTFVKESLKYNNKIFDVIKQINFFTLLEVVILILIATWIFNLLNKTAKSKFFKKLPSAYFKILTLIRIIFAVIIFYILITLLFGSSKEIILLIILLLMLLIGVSSVPLWKNFMGGLLIFYNPPFEVGDFIKIHTHEGKVLEIHWLFTSIVTDDNSRITIPNSIFLQQPVENVNVGQAEHLISIEFEIPMNLPLEKVSDVLKQAAISTPYAHSKYKPEVFLKKVDMQRKVNVFETNLYIFDRAYENEARNYLNESIISEIKKIEEFN
ncbi:mechanosensitive ion channel domain-containing protein [Melioribacteraceae bacterium 4301-Me]|uniref:mechanosensitive ion channel domain-containing protein n=1 Tax=Pyranulibacter aquaticus TaxID=3163344 RepID=UPI00359AC5C0